MARDRRDDGEQKAFLGRGWSFPVATDPLTGRVAAVAYEDDIHQAIWIILATRPGERVMRPDFGCGIHDLVFETIETRALALIVACVRDGLAKFERRVEVINVAADPSRAAEGVLAIGIDYRVRRTNQRGNLVYPFFYREGGQA